MIHIFPCRYRYKFDNDNKIHPVHMRYFYYKWAGIHTHVDEYIDYNNLKIKYYNEC